ncbi:MAG: type I-C CRISPR-associated protein Cas7/Csd2 [Bacteroidales bacterium]
MIKNRHEIAVFVSIKNGNPNGNPEADGRPRQCPVTGNGLISDVCTKRKQRNYIQNRYAGDKGRQIFVREGVVLDDIISSPYDLDKDTKKAFEARKAEGKGKYKGPSPETLAKDYLCKNYADIRYFGGVLSTGDKESVSADSEADAGSKRSSNAGFRKTAGKVTGPISISWAESVHPIFSGHETLTRCCATNPKDEHKGQTMGSKSRIPYALYKFEVRISPTKSEKTNFSEEDLKLFCEALTHMYDDDFSSARPASMVVEKAWMFTHESKFGNAPAHKLLARAKAMLKDGVTVPGKTEDYDISLDTSNMPKGVSVKELTWENTNPEEK